MSEFLVPATMKGEGKVLYRTDLLHRVPLDSTGVMVNPLDVAWLKAVLYLLHPHLVYMISTWSFGVERLVAIARLASAQCFSGEARIVYADPMDAAGSVCRESLDWAYLGYMDTPDAMYEALRVWADRVRRGGIVLARMSPNLTPGWDRYCAELGIVGDWRAEGRRSMYSFQTGGASEAT